MKHAIHSAAVINRHLHFVREENDTHPVGKKIYNNGQQSNNDEEKAKPEGNVGNRKCLKLTKIFQRLNH